MGQQLFTLIHLEKLEHCETHFNVEVSKLLCFWQHAHCFTYAATLLNILHQKRVLHFFHTWTFFKDVRIGLHLHEYHGLYSSATPFLSQFCLFSTGIDCFQISFSHFSPFNVVFRGHFLKRKNWKWKSK